MNAEKLTARPRTTKELCTAYGVSHNTLKKWLRMNPQIPSENPKVGRYWTIAELRVIVEAIGEP